MNTVWSEDVLKATHRFHFIIIVALRHSVAKHVSSRYHFNGFMPGILIEFSWKLHFNLMIDETASSQRIRIDAK